MQGGFSKAYREKGVDKFYEEKGTTYHNPHQYDIERLIRKMFSKQNEFIKKDSRILDLACGSGEVSLVLKGLGYTNISGTDPYTFQIYEKKTGFKCEKQTFLDIVNENAMHDRKYDAIVISYALHLVQDSMLYEFLYKLAEISTTLIVIAPHKNPVIKPHYGWIQVENVIKDRIHCRIYRTNESLQVTENNQNDGKH